VIRKPVIDSLRSPVVEYLERDRRDDHLPQGPFLDVSGSKPDQIRLPHYNDATLAEV
jgi:hypothetical protein